MKQNVLLILHFDDFLFDLPFKATSHICWMIAITIGTFCFIVTFMIVMSSLSTFCTFCFVLAESFVVVVFLTIKTTLWIWNVNYVNESGKQLWSEGVCLDYLWLICRNLKEPTAHLFASSYVQLWSHLVISVYLWCPLHPYFAVLYSQSHILKNWELCGVLL